MTQANPICVGLLFLVTVRIKFVREEIELKISLGCTSESILPLNARTRRDFELQKSVADSCPLITVFSPAVRLKAEAAKAERGVLIDTGEDAFSSICIVFSSKPGRSEN